jgi:DNA end-binding protein Ku
MNAAWKGAISLGGPMMMANFAAYKANDDKESGTSFRQICPDCDHPINQIKVCKNCGRTDIPSSELKAGAPAGAKDTFVILTKDEVKTFDEQDNTTLEIVKFVDAMAVDPMRVTKSYYLAPIKDDRTRPTFGLIRATLADCGKAAIGTITLEKRTQLAAVLAVGKGLLLHLLRPASLIRSQSDVPGLDDVPEADAKFLLMAKQVVGMMEDDTIDIATFKDERAERLIQFINAKMEGQELTTPILAAKPMVMDLQAALEATLAALQIKQEAPITDRPKPRTKKGKAA